MNFRSSIRSTKSRRRSSPTCMFNADDCSSLKESKPMPKLSRKGSNGIKRPFLRNSQDLAKTDDHPLDFPQPSYPPFHHVTHGCSRPNLASLDIRDNMMDMPLFQSQATSSRPMHNSVLIPLPADPDPLTEYIPPTPESEDEGSAPMSEFFSVAHQRRRKMDKVTRTLGEWVPAELVFPALTKAEVLMEFRPHPQAVDSLFGGKDMDKSKSEDKCKGKGKDMEGEEEKERERKEKEKREKKEKKAARRASISVSALSNFASLSTLTGFTTGLLPLSSPSVQVEDAQIAAKNPHSKFSKKAMDMSPRSSLNDSPTSSALASPDSSSFFSGSSSQRHGTSLDLKDQKASSGSRWMQIAPKTVRDKPGAHLHDFTFESRPASPFYDVLPPTPVTSVGEGAYSDSIFDFEAKVGRSVTRTRTEKTQGWTGEWNRDDMQDVLKKLRALK